MAIDPDDVRFQGKTGSRRPTTKKTRSTLTRLRRVADGGCNMPSSSKTKSKCVKAAGNVSGRLSEFDGRDGPLPFVASDGDSQAMHFVEPNALHRTGLAVGKDHGLADKLSLGLLELAEDRARAILHG